MKIKKDLINKLNIKILFKINYYKVSKTRKYF